MLTKKFLIKKSYPENYFKVGGGGGEFTIQMKTWVRVDEDCQLKKRGGGVRMPYTDRDVHGEALAHQFMSHAQS